jgi:hypothetical protein
MTRLGILAVGLALAASCSSDTQTGAHDPLAPSTGATTPDFAGGQVNHFFANFSHVADPDRQLAVPLGLVSPVSDVDFCGGPGAEFDGVTTVQEVVTRTGVHVQVHMRQGGTLVLYGASPSPPEDVCDLAFAPVLGKGHGNYAVAVSDQQQTAAGVSILIHVTGTIDLTAGGRAHVL